MADYNPTTCVNQLTAAGLVPVCDQLQGAPYHCEDLVQQNPALHSWCYANGQVYTPVQSPACIRYDNNVKPVEYAYYPPNKIFSGCAQKAPQAPTDVNGYPTGAGWAVGYCYCCCSCLAYNTLIAVPTGAVPVQNLLSGDEVLAGSVDAKGRLSWSSVKLSFSDGSASETTHDAVYMTFGDDTWSGDLICTMDQPIMLANGKLITADKLQVGDQLMGKDGKAVPLTLIAMGTHQKGIHHIGTSVSGDPGQIDGHLIVAGGIVVGDYYLQLHLDSAPDSMKHAEHAERPALGSKAYDDSCKSVAGAASLVFGQAELRGARRIVTGDGSHFTMYAQRASYEGALAASFFTDAQAKEVMKNGKQLPISNAIPKAEVQSLLRVFKGNYPDLSFYLDWHQPLPNVHAVEEYGQKFVVITGGMARMTVMSYEGLAMAIGHGVSRWLHLPPIGDEGFTGTGASDFYAFTSVSRNLWWGNRWLGFVKAALAQVKGLFELALPTAEMGKTKDPVNDPSIACRIETIYAAAGGGGIPECCGGEPLPKIGIESVAGSTKGAELVLSVAPTPDTAKVISNYTFTPAAEVKQALQDPTQDFRITLVADLDAGQNYTLKIKDLESALGSGVDPNDDEKSFVVPSE